MDELLMEVVMIKFNFMMNKQGKMHGVNSHCTS